MAIYKTATDYIQATVFHPQLPLLENEKCTRHHGKNAVIAWEHAIDGELKRVSGCTSCMEAAVTRARRFFHCEMEEATLTCECCGTCKMMFTALDDGGFEDNFTLYKADPQNPIELCHECHEEKQEEAKIRNEEIAIFKNLGVDYTSIAIALYRGITSPAFARCVELYKEAPSAQREALISRYRELITDNAPGLSTMFNRIVGT